MIYNMTWLVALLIFLGSASDRAIVQAAENGGGVVAEEMVIEDALSGDLKPDRAAQKDLEPADTAANGVIAEELGLAPQVGKEPAPEKDASAKGVDVAAELGVAPAPTESAKADAAVAEELGLTGSFRSEFLPGDW